MWIRSVLVGTVVVLAVLVVPTLAQVAATPSLERAREVVAQKNLLEPTARFIVAVPLDPAREGDEWRPLVSPDSRHVDPGAQLVLVNLTRSEARFQFKEEFFDKPGTAFSVGPDQATVLRVRPDVAIGDGDERRFYLVRFSGGARDYPGPKIYVP